MKIYCDSSTREACLVFEGQEPIIIPYSERVTVNVGEYQAVILALEEAERLKLKQVELLTDSRLVVEQANRRWACKKKHLQELREELWSLASQIDCTLKWIPREENLAGRVLS